MTALREFRLPDIGEGLDAAELLEWHVEVGAPVREDEPLADVQTDKAIVTIPCPVSGRVVELRFATGDSVPVGAVVAVIDPVTPDAGSQVTSPPAAVLASPAVRRLARSRGIDLSSMTGSGPSGRIRREDLDDGPAPTVAAPQGPVEAVAPRGDARVPLTPTRRLIAHRLTEAWRTVPHVIDYREADATALLAARDLARRRARDRGDVELERALTLVPFLVMAAARALAEHPYLNASLDMDNEEITLHSQCHIGIATSTEDGLMVPVLRDAGSLSLGQIARQIARLTGAARERRLTAADLRGATFTVNNFGALGIWLGTPIVTPPQVANLGVGRVAERPVVRDGQIVATQVLTLSVSGDHRALDGDTLARFVSRAVELIESPILLFLGDD